MDTEATPPLRTRRRLIAGAAAGTVAAVALAATAFLVTRGGGGDASPQSRAQQAGLPADGTGPSSGAAGLGASGSASASASPATAGTCDGTLFGGDLVLAQPKGYWTAWSQGGTARLEHFTTGASDATGTTAAKTAHPHLVAYGTGRMLLAWESGATMTAQVYDTTAAKPVGGTFTVDVKDHAYQAFKSYADGSVAYPAAGANATTIRVARVMPMR